MESGLVNPEFLSGLLIMLPLGLFLWSSWRERNRLLQALGSAKTEPFPRGALVVFVLSALLVFGLARPYWGYKEIDLSSSGRDIMAVVDISRSMLTRDVSPSRLAVAKRKLHDLVTLIQKDSPGDRIGIVLFAGDGYLFCPPTADYPVLKVYINSIEHGLISSLGTDLRRAVDAAIQSLDNIKAWEPILLLISDGEDVSLDSAPIIAQLKGRRLSLNVIGVGTLEGQPIEVSPGRFVHDQSGNVVVSKLNEQALQNLANATSGVYRRAGLDDSDLKAVIQKDLKARSQGQTRLRTYNELGPFILWAVLGVVILSFALGRRSLAFSTCLLLTFTPPWPVLAQDLQATPLEDYIPSSPYEAAKAYKSGNYEAARKGFEQSLARDAENLKIIQALGSTYYKQGKFSEAKRLFSELSKKAKSGRQLFEAFYNLGNTNLMERNYEAAIENYEKALTIKPGDEQAKFNLELAIKLSQEEQPPPKEQQQQKQNEQKGEQAEEKKAPTPPPQHPIQSQSLSSLSQTDGASSSTPQSEAQQSMVSEEETSFASAEKPSPSQSSSAESAAGEAGSQASLPSSLQNASSPASGEPQQTFSAPLRDDSSASETGSALPSPDTQPEFGRGEKQNYDPAELKKEEAKAWLDSLPDSPVLLMKKTKNRRDDGSQTW